MSEWTKCSKSNTNNMFDHGKLLDKSIAHIMLVSGMCFNPVWTAPHTLVVMPLGDASLSLVTGSRARRFWCFNRYPTTRKRLPLLRDLGKGSRYQQANKGRRRTSGELGWSSVRAGASVCMLDWTRGVELFSSWWNVRDWTGNSPSRLCPNLRKSILYGCVH